MAAQRKRSPGVEYISQRRAELKISASPYACVFERRHRSWLCNAVRTKNTKLVNDLLCTNRDANLTDERGLSLLHIAASFGHDDIIRSLLESGANPNGRDSQGNTPLHLAVSASNRLAVKDLLAAGSDVTLVNQEGRTPLQIAQDKLRLDVDSCKLFEGSKFNVNPTIDVLMKNLHVQIQDPDEINAPVQFLQVTSTKEEADSQLNDILEYLERLTRSMKVTNEV